MLKYLEAHSGADKTEIT